ncbi:Arb2 domain-containing protein [Kickxella alabastrina]|uniref:Arb2 domain-containing protein n=1 Tax=Kickxella alabastrina TaxID=61397 RepID=UPI002220B4FC|nr:Arb2 domain-containing protein [Kickxella alabastrina]KAI7827260.1 Arb2 domain-containing protein [Kickxella alabastrina]
MFIRPKKPEAEPLNRQTLRDLGYAFDEADGLMKSTVTGDRYDYEHFPGDKKKNQEYYQALINPASRQVSEILRTTYEMHPIAVPDARQPHCNIYATPKALSKDKLVVIVNGHGNFAGVWAWNVLTKDGLKAGSVIEYVRNCVLRGYGVLVLNPNENICAPDGVSETFNSYVGQITNITGSETSSEHVGYVWSRIIRPAAKHVVFVAYNTAGIAMIDLLKYDYGRFTGKTAGIAFIDSAHSTFQLSSGPLAWLPRCSKQWVTASEPQDCAVSNELVGCPSVSAGNQSDCRELTPWMCMNTVLDFIDQCFERGPVVDVEEFGPEDILDLAEGSDSENEALDMSNLESVRVLNAGEAAAAVQDGYCGWD